MNLFNNIQKVKYTRNQQEAVALKEYIIFDDEKAKEKYVVLKLTNNLNQRLYDIKIEVSQYDECDELVEKTIVSYNTKVEENDDFVPKAKLKVNYLCKTISYKLIYARFERLRYENGEFFEIAHKFETHHATLPPVKQAPIVEVVNKQSPKESKQKFRMRENYGKNIAKFPRFFNALVIIASVAFTVVSLISFRLNTRQFTVNNVDYYILNENEIIITGYDAMEKEFVVPSSIDNRKVTRIMNGAFKNSRLEKITIKNEGFVIESNAFDNCDNLKEVYISSRASILQNAFVDCDSLSRVYMPKSNLLENTFVSINNLESLTFAKTSLEGLTDAFTVEEGETLFINKLSTQMTYIPEGFLDQTHISTLDILDTCKVGFGNYVHVDKLGYENNGTVETIYGEVIAINTKDKKLTIDSNIYSLDVNKFANELRQIETLNVEGMSDVLTKELYSQLYNLKVLETFDLSSFGKEVLDVCDTVDTVICPVPFYEISSYIGNRSNIKHLQLKGSSYLSRYMTKNLPYLRSVKISNDIFFDETNMFENSYNIKSIETPLVNSFMPFLTTFTSMQGVENVVLTPREVNISEGYFDGLSDIKTIEVKEGINYISGCIISNAPSLNTVTLPNNMTYLSLPVIGENCTSLANVTYDAGNCEHRYADFNLSNEATRQLKVTNLAYTSLVYLEDTDNLISLHVEGSRINYLGLLANQKYLTNLYIKSDSLSTYFSDMFFETSELANNSKVLSALQTVVIETNNIPAAYFEKVKGVENIYLQEVKAVGKDAFKEISGLQTLYVPSTLDVSKSLLSDLADAGVKVYFESEGKIKYNGYKETGVLFEDLYESL